MSHHPLDHLPPELWEAVARYLKPEDIYNFAEASPFWYDLLMERQMLPIIWVPRVNGDIPKFAFCGVFGDRSTRRKRKYSGIHLPSGKDGGDPPKEVFVVRASLDRGESIWTRGCRTGSTGVVPGRLHNGESCAYVSYGGRELRKTDYEVLVAPAEALEWVETEGGNIPEHALVGGQDPNPNRDPYYIARVAHQGTTTVGKVHRTYKSCYVAYGGKEHEYSKYEILVKTELGRELKYIYE